MASRSKGTQDPNALAGACHPVGLPLATALGTANADSRGCRILKPMGSPEDEQQTAPAAVAIVGTGNVAQALGICLMNSGVPVTAIAGRNAQRTKAAAAFVGARHAVTIDVVASHAATVLLAVSDHAIGPVAERLAHASPLPAVVLHTCGSQGPEVLAPLRDVGCATGVLHPLQTIPSPQRGAASIPGCTFAYCGDAVAALRAMEFIRLLSGRSLAVDPAKWPLYHAAAVLSINFHVTLLDATLELWEQAGISRQQALDALAPIVRAGTDNILRYGPEQALTGPIQRGDSVTLERHLAALLSGPASTRSLYRAAALRTIELARRTGLAESAVQQLLAALDEESLR